MILLIGFGNTLRGDDGLGPALVERLAASVSHPTLKVIPCQQLTPELALEIASSEVKGVLFADASICSTKQGVQITRVQPIPSETAIGHYGDPSGLLFLATQLYGACPPAWMITLPGCDFGFDSRLSSQGQKILEEGERRVMALLAELSKL